MEIGLERCHGERAVWGDAMERGLECCRVMS